LITFFSHRPLLPTVRSKEQICEILKILPFSYGRQTEGWAAEIIPEYDNEDNPFGDSTLTQPFR